MKISLTSDWHFEFYNSMDMVVALDRLNSLECDLNIVAGDVHSNALLFDYFEEKLDNGFVIKGNHDYYNQKLANEPKVLDIQGVKVVGCTLWTSFNDGDPYAEFSFRTGMADPRFIKADGDLVKQISEINKHNFELIMDSQPDIVVTHHCPTYRSVHERYKDDVYMNYSFVNNYEKHLKNSKIKYWVFGHTHWRHQYQIGNTKFLCNPRGYPNEVKDEYSPLVFDL